MVLSSHISLHTGTVNLGQYERAFSNLDQKVSFYCLDLVKKKSDQL